MPVLVWAVGLGCNAKKLKFSHPFDWTQRQYVYTVLGYGMAIENTGTLDRRDGRERDQRVSL